LKFSSAQVAKKMRRLGIAHPLLHSFDFVFDVSVGHENVRPSIVIVVEEETTEAKRHQSRAPDLRLRRLIYEQAIAFVVVERKHLIREICDDETWASRTIVVGGVHAHAGASYAVFAESDS